MAHKHRVKSTSDAWGYTGPVSRNENPVAHGGVMFIDTCACGAKRKRNCNAGQEERGDWYGGSSE